MNTSSRLILVVILIFTSSFAFCDGLLSEILSAPSTEPRKFQLKEGVGYVTTNRIQVGKLYVSEHRVRIIPEDSEQIEFLRLFVHDIDWREIGMTEVMVGKIEIVYDQDNHRALLLKQPGRIQSQETWACKVICFDSLEVATIPLPVDVEAVKGSFLTNDIVDITYTRLDTKSWEYVRINEQFSLDELF